LKGDRSIYGYNSLHLTLKSSSVTVYSSTARRRCIGLPCSRAGYGPDLFTWRLLCHFTDGGRPPTTPPATRHGRRRRWTTASWM